MTVHPRGPRAAILPDGRLHLHYGPIDLIICAEGEPRAVQGAYTRAMARFDGLLEELVAELAALRSPDPQPLTGAIALAMAAAVAPHRPAFITPMAAVAGAVADAVLAAMVGAPGGAGLTRAHVNNGGDIALHLAPGESLTAAIALHPDLVRLMPAALPGRVTLRHGDAARGIATSGWRGRSWSLGIADAVTVLARTAAEADAAATMIANAVDLPGHPAILRRAAVKLQSDSDLGRLPVTVHVGALTAAEVAAALDRGAAHAQALLGRGIIAGAAIFLHPETRTLGRITLAATPET
ncbi:UPF0280 family protein [Paracoccaceae bacterium Fryx2]|nr:UPF0280 family protein [Paracoccaceae bacterium Fryx2]